MYAAGLYCTRFLGTEKLMRTRIIVNISINFPKWILYYNFDFLEFAHKLKCPDKTSTGYDMLDFKSYIKN